MLSEERLEQVVYSVDRAYSMGYMYCHVAATASAIVACHSGCNHHRHSEGENKNPHQSFEMDSVDLDQYRNLTLTCSHPLA